MCVHTHTYKYIQEGATYVCTVYILILVHTAPMCVGCGSICVWGGRPGPSTSGHRVARPGAADRQTRSMTSVAGPSTLLILAVAMAGAAAFAPAGAGGRAAPGLAGESCGVRMGRAGAGSLRKHRPAAHAWAPVWLDRREMCASGLLGGRTRSCQMQRARSSWALPASTSGK